MSKRPAIIVLFCIPLLAGCASGSLSKRETGALGGGALGAGAGALIGHATAIRPAARRSVARSGH